MTALKATSREARSTQFYLPVMPVPLSACFKNVRGNGRAATPRYTRFKARVDMHLFVSRLRGKPACELFTGPVRVQYVLSKPDKRRRDLDNLLKALNDTLTRNFILEDDSQIVDLRIGWTLEEMPMPVLVQIEQVVDG